MISMSRAPTGSDAILLPDRSGETTPAIRGPSIALALGGGGARGLAHIPMLEAFDELGLKPRVIAGTSIGAVFGAAYASGLSAREIRAHTQEILTLRFDLMRELFSARARSANKLLGIFSTRNALLDPLALLDILMPSRVARRFADLKIPLKLVTTNFYAQEAVVITQGDLMPAIAASMALPAIFQPVLYDGYAHVDGGLTNPLPFDLVAGNGDIVVAVDVSGTPTPSADRALPTATEALFASAFIWERSLIKEKLKSARPDIYIDAGTSHFQVLDFLKLPEILAAANPAKQRLKAKLELILSSETVASEATGVLQAVAAPQPLPPAKKKRRGILGRAPRLRRDKGKTG